MNSFLTAEQLFSALRQMPSKEQEKFASLVFNKALCGDDNLTHEELFGHLKDQEFTAKDAAEYLDVSIATFRRYIEDGKIKASSEIGSSNLYSLAELRELKKARNLLKK